jgi:hypothetical protein
VFHGRGEARPPHHTSHCGAHLHSPVGCLCTKLRGSLSSSVTEQMRLWRRKLTPNLLSTARVHCSQPPQALRLVAAGRNQRLQEWFEQDEVELWELCRLSDYAVLFTQTGFAHGARARDVGIIRALPGRQVTRRLVDSDRAMTPRVASSPSLFPSARYRRGHTSEWSRPTHGPARARSRCGPHRFGAAAWQRCDATRGALPAWPSGSGMSAPPARRACERCVRPHRG